MASGKLDTVKKPKKIENSKSIDELQEIWGKDKNTFRIKELGGLQDFVCDVLLSKELFGISEGRESTKLEKRKNEITRETHKEGGRGRADIIIYINGDDIVIPVEVEKFGNIKAGESQILQYQTDWRKKYGILTDGNEWRFYFDRAYETFYLEKDIFNKKSEFWKKWNLYKSPETYYNMTFNPKGQLELFEAERLDPCTFENRPFFFNDITKLLSNFKSKISALVPLLKEERTAIETTYSYVIQFILYKVLIDNNSEKLKNDYEAFRGWVKKALQTGDYGRVIKDIKKISEYIYQNVYEPFRQKQEDINKKLIEQLKQSPTLNDIAPWLDIIMFIDRYNFADIQNELFGFVYENYLKELYHDENKGQYFTDPAVVNFMLHELGYTADKLRENKNNISIIDPSCGAGTFLYSATAEIKQAFNKNTVESSRKVEELINNNVFGLDIEEFPLFLAEMNILMQLLPIVVNANYNNPINEKLKLFITKDSISEFLDTSINPIVEDERKKGQGLFDGFGMDNTPPYMRRREDLQDLFQSLEGDLATRLRFDYVIGNPPYIGYNECSKKRLEFIKRIQDKDDKSISMGNVYGINLNSTPVLHKKNTPKPNLYAFFIALGLALLKNNGKICYIISQNILQSRDLDVIRYYLSKFTTIEEIITFEGNLFVGRGLTQKKPIATSSLIFIARKKTPATNHIVKIVNYMPYTEKQAGDFSVYLRSRNKETKTILQSILLEKMENWNFLKQDDKYLLFMQKYKNDSNSVEEYRKNVLKDYDDVCFDIGYNIDEKKLLNKENFYIFPNLEKKYFTVHSARGFLPKNINIKLCRSNQGHKLLEKKYKILWYYNNPDKFYFSEKNIISARNKICFIGSDDKREHLFLFSLLNSTVNKIVLNNTLRVANEKAILIGLSSIKQYIRVPKITQENKAIKTEIIKQTEAMLNLEEPVLNDIVDFPNKIIQSFESIRVVGNTLVLCYGDKSCTAKIKNGKIKIVEDLVNSEYFPNGSLLPKKDIILEDLRFLPAIDFEEQEKIKNYIDDLVFALYFNVKLSALGINNVDVIKKACAKHEFYTIVKS
jgi:hypothetical protein